MLEIYNKKIPNLKQITVFTADLPLRKVYQHSAAQLTRFEQVYVKLSAEVGIIAYAEVRGNCPYATGERREDILRSLRDEVIPLLKECSGKRLKDVLHVIDRRVSSRGARTLIDVALHDLVAKAAGLPLYEFFGGMKLPIIAGYHEVPFADLRETEFIAKEGVRAGASLFKVRVGMKPVELDVERLAVVREIISDRELAVDANQAWTVREAIDNIKKLAKYNLAFVEQPVSAKDIGGLRAVREETGIPIMADESLAAVDDLDKLVQQEAVDMVNIKLIKLGGIFNSIKVIQRAEQYKIGFLLESMSSGRLEVGATLHLQCSIGANAKYFSAGGFKDVLNDPAYGIELEGNKVRVPSLPGIGVSLNESMVREEFSVRLQ